jgi:hypothetical protein
LSEQIAFSTKVDALEQSKLVARAKGTTTKQIRAAHTTARMDCFLPFISANAMIAEFGKFHAGRVNLQESRQIFMCLRV